MSAIKPVLTIVCAATLSVAVSAPALSDCVDFRCRFGDVPKANAPLIVEPFHAFYRDSVVRPMRPYHDWEPTARRWPETLNATATTKETEKTGTTKASESAAP